VKWAPTREGDAFGPKAAFRVLTSFFVLLRMRSNECNRTKPFGTANVEFDLRIVYGYDIVYLGRRAEEQRGAKAVGILFIRTHRKFAN